jgi:hypothetical protein
MTAFLALLTRLFDALFWPFRSLNPIWALLAMSVLTGILMLIIFRYTSNQEAIRQVKERLKAHLLALWLFQDQLSVVFRTQGRLLYTSLIYTRHALIPLAVMIVPLVLIMLQLEVRLGQSPVRPGDSFLLTATLADPARLAQASLDVPAGLTLTAPPVRIPELREVNWRIAGAAAGDYTLEVSIDDQTFSKKVIVGDGVAALSSRRTRNGVVDTLLNPTETALPDAAPVESIQVNYRPSDIALGPWRMHWLIPFFVFSLVAAFAFKGVFKTEF